ncbi:acyltransferase family protein [Legionella lytica]|uniref:Acyltransferase family protein n=1 Tax=Legionella lytica TaxID=96232 RepID=A0ABW8DC58_9GAMM
MNRKNNLDFLRFMAAALVIYGHGQVLLGLQPSTIIGISIHVLGVQIFFGISGYLISASWQRQQSITIFLANRALRIFPALICIVILSALVLGPLVTSLSFREYTTNIHFFYYFRNCVLYTSYNLPGVFNDNFYKYAVNGSLWSLAPEFFCYVTVAFVGLVTRGRSAIFLFILLFCIFTLTICLHPYYIEKQTVIYATDLVQASNVIIYFMLGAIFQRIRVVFKKSVSVLLIILCLFLPYITTTPVLTMCLYAVMVTYVALNFGLSTTPILNNWGKYGDFSYGMYLSSFPIQQLLIYLTNNKTHSLLLIISTLILSILYGIISWHYVERIALKMKPQRGELGSNGTDKVFFENSNALLKGVYSDSTGLS